MHGFFIDLRLYEKAKSIASPFDYANFKKAQVQSKIEKERGSRIRASRNLPKVNRELATKLLSSSHPGILDSSDDSDDLEGGKVKKTSAKKKSKMVARENATAENPLGDDRFAAAFKDEAFAVDTTNPEYTLHYPVESKKAVSSRIADFEKVEESEEESEAEGRPFDASSSEDNGDEPEKKQARKPEKAAKPSFYQVKDGRMAKFGAGKSNESSTKDQALTFEDRMKKTKNSGGDSIINMSRQKSGNASLTFVPRDGRDDDSDDGGGYKKRGVGELGLESSRGRGRGRGGDRGSRGGGRGGARGGRGGRGGSRGGSSRGGPRGSRGGSRGGRGRGK
jgi:ribosome biogenesis protein ENP2